MKPLSLLARLMGAEGSNFQPTKLIIETLEDPALQNLLTQDDLTGLLKGLGKKHAHSSSTDDLREANLLVKRLIELGGNPWAVEGLVEYWAKNNLPERVDYAFKMKPSEINSPINSWMALAVSANHTRMAVMLLEHGAHINLRGGHYLAHATTPEMVSLLCERGADMNNPDISGLFPMARWITNAKNNEKDITLAARLSIVAAESYLAMGNDLLGPGFHLLPYISSVVDTRKARVYGGLCASGFESIPLKGEQFVSPLSGWALSILKRQADPHARDSLVLIRECFKAREGTLDEEWFLAAAALDMWTSKRDRAYARLEWTIEQRIQELQRLPSLSKEEGSRWDDVMTKMSKLSGSSYGVSLSLVLNQAAVQQVLLGSMEGGWISHSMGTLEQLNTFTHRVGLHNSEWVKKVSSYSWRNGISEQFWERQHFVCPKWVSFASDPHLINDLSMRLERGLRMPEGLDPSRRWPESIATWMEAQELNKKTDISSHVPRPRRM